VQFENSGLAKNHPALYNAKNRMNLLQFESRLKAILEVEIPKFVPGRQVEDIIVQKIATAIHANTKETEDHALLAPDTFSLILHPLASAKWQDPKMQKMLLSSITVVAQEAGFRFIIAPTITISKNEQLQKNDAEVVASHRAEPMQDTNATPLDTGNLDEQGLMPENAFLIVEGVKVFPLSVPVVNIGRRLDNQLIIDDPRVSRNHAQLRAIKGRFVVFDLNSTGGTFVNGQRASQSVLYPGDVISLAGVTLIFGQDNPPPRPDLKDTAPLQDASANRPTAFLKDQQSSPKPDKK
jgi:hypothetical protein